MTSDKTDFTQGNILKKLVPFMIPILGALILQAAYGAVDLLVVGRFGSTSGLSAVSTGSQVLNLSLIHISIIALANVVVQSNINSFGKMAVAGCGAYSKVEGFGFLPITCFSLALTTFISQNLGAKQYDRAKRGARFGILCSITLAEIVGICVYFLSPYLIAAFNSDPEVVAYGTLQAHTITLFYFLLAFSHCIAGIMRGAGKATVPMLSLIHI